MIDILIKYAKKIPFSHEIKFFVYRLLKPKFLYFISNSTKPISSIYGIERGRPIDRLYIEKFLEKNKKYIKGNCLELLNNKYTLNYGGIDVLKSDVLDIDKNNKNANIWGDLKNLKNVIPDNTYNCIILTQVLQFIDDFDAALLECRRILKPEGYLLITVPSLGRIDCVAGTDGDFWRFTTASIKYILKEKFENFKVSSFGNSKTGMAFWIGLSQEDINKHYYEKNDEDFPILITAVVKK